MDLNSKESQCSLGIFEALNKLRGKIVDNEALNKVLSSPKAKAVYANADAKYQSTLAQGAIDHGLLDKWTQKGLDAMEKIGIPAKDVYSVIASPEAIIGKEPVAKVEALYHDFLEKRASFGKGLSKERLQHVWDSKYAPKVKEVYYDTFKQFSQNGEYAAKRDYLTKYFDKHIAGGQIYGQTGVANPLSRLGRNAVSNLVTWNPMITAMNAFEFTPKALAYSLEHGNPSAVLKGMATYFEKTGGKFWQRIPELEQKGVYGMHEHGKGFLGATNLLDVTENPLRGLSYYVGEAINPGQGMDALEKIAFVSRMGNEPLIFLDHSGTDTLALMRYSLSSTKMYTQLAQNAAKGDTKALGAFIAFSAINAIQTGGESALPAPVDMVLNDDAKQAIHEFDDQTGLNLAKHFLGTDYTQQTQPLGLPILGAGLSIANEDVKGTGTAIKKAVAAGQEGNSTELAARILQATFKFGQLAKIPGVNLTSSRIVDAIASTAAGDIMPEELPTEVAKKTKIYVEPK